LLVLTLFAAHPAKADTYKTTVVDMTQNENFLGIDDQGDFVVNDSNNSFKCGQLNGPCYEIFLLGQSPFFSTTAPALAFDNGSSCTIVLDASFAPEPTASAMCNDGHEIFGAFTTVTGPAVFYGPNTSDEILGGATFDGGFINANGDAVFIDGYRDELIFAQDLTSATPEPGSLYLLGTGCLAMAGAFRRDARFRQKPVA
jgi:hypothetical protein